MKPAVYVCTGCETRIPSTLVERKHRHGSARYIEIAKVICDNDDCPMQGMELHRDPPFWTAPAR